MMILDDISTYLDPEVRWPAKLYHRDFSFGQRYIGNFLRRRVKQLRYRTENFRRVLFQGRTIGYDAPGRIQGDAALVVPIPFDQPRYDFIGPGEKHEFFLGMYIQGIEKAHRDFPIPYDVLMQGIEDFRKGGYKNEWVHSRQLIKPLGLHASLLCVMDTDEFRLTLLLERKGATVYKDTIFTTMPDEIMFGYKFKDVILVGDKLVVRTKMHTVENQILFTLDVNPLG
jgi:hypothetical protein